MVFSNNLLLGAGGQSTGTVFDPTLIGNSVWLDGSADFLSAELGAKTRTKAVIGTWIQKTGFTTSDATIFSKKGSAQFAIRMQDQASKAGKISIFDYDGGSFQYSAESTTMLLRDIGWYHIMISIDTTASAGNRLRYYINGIDQTSTLTVSTDYTASDNPSITGGSGEPTQWGVGTGGASQFNPCYLAQSFMLDDDSIQNGDVAVTDILDAFTLGTNGSEFTPKSDADIAALATTAGGDSFCLDFSNSGSLGLDSSALGNDFTPTSMSSANQSTNTPSLVYPSLSNIVPASESGQGMSTLTNGNLSVAAQTNRFARSAMIVNSTFSKLYYEVTFDTVDATYDYPRVGIALTSYTGNDLWSPGAFAGSGYGLQANTSTVMLNGSNLGTNAGFSSGNVCMVAFDPATGKIWTGKNGTYFNSGDPAGGTGEVATITGDEWKIFVGGVALSGSAYSVNFGQSAFAHTVPVGFASLASSNLTAPDYQGIDYFNATLYTGNGTAIGSGGKAVTGVGFQPDFTWIKNRDAADSHILTDVVRGVTKYMSSDSTAAEVTNTESLSTFDTDGFTVGNLAAVNTNTEDYVSWNWLAGGTGSSNTDGSITSNVTVADAGHLSIGTYTGTGANATIGHGLTAAPEFVNVKQLNSTASWSALIPAIGNSNAIFLNLTNAATSVGTAYWQNTDPTPSVFSIGTDNGVNASSSTYLFQCFRSVPGVCKVGTYVGNLNADGPYIDLGFTPRFFLVKVTDGVNNWGIFDTARNTFNVSNRTLNANDATVEDTSYPLDILSNGIKIRGAFQFFNDTGKTYLYLAMADIGGNGTLPPVYGR